VSGLRFGVLLSTRLAALRGADPGDFVAQAERAEAAGFDSVWLGDSLLARPRPEPLVLLAGIAARTRRIALGTAVLLPALRHPVTAAHAIATLDALSRGRLVLGVGAGFPYPASARELAAVGVPFAERSARLVEAIAIWRALFAGKGPASFAGRFVSFEDVELTPQPARPGGPPIWLGGNAPGALRRAARLADGWMPTSASPKIFAEGLARMRDEAARLGRDPSTIEPALMATLHVDPDRATAQRELRAFMEPYYGVPLEALSKLLGCHAGSAAQCADWLAGYAEAGVRHFILRFAAMDQQAQQERVAAQVLPHLPGLRAR
jgi:probable F420-dependent oxidoreductase